MYRWLFAFCAIFLVVGWSVLSGLVHLAAEVVKLVAYGAFGIAIVLLGLGFLTYSKVKSSFGSGE